MERGALRLCLSLRRVPRFRQVGAWTPVCATGASAPRSAWEPRPPC